MSGCHFEHVKVMKNVPDVDKIFCFVGMHKANYFFASRSATSAAIALAHGETLLGRKNLEPSN